MLAEHRVQEIAVSVNRAIEVTPGASHLDVGLVEVPGAACLAAAAGAQSFANQRGESELPCSDGLMCDRIPPLTEQFSDIAKAEFVTESPEDRQEDDVRRELEIVIGRARALVVAAMAGTTGEPAVTKGGTMLTLGGLLPSGNAGTSWAAPCLHGDQPTPSEP
jgi:hypothetical protein